MRILFIDTPLEPPGGGQRSLYYILKYINRSEFDIQIFLPYECEFANWLKDLKIEYKIVPLKNLFFEIKKYNPDIVYSNSATTKYCFFSAVFARILGKKFIWHNRVLDTAGWKDKFIAFLSNKIVVISDAVADKFKDFKHKTVKIPNAVDTEEFKNAMDKEKVKQILGIEKDCKVIGQFSRLEKWKGYDLFIEVIKKLSDKNLKFKALIAGSGDYHDEVVKKISEFGISEKVVLLGYRKNVYDYMNVCDVICSLSIRPEAFGRVIIEGMLLKKVVISTDIGGPKEIIEDGIDGFLVKTDAEQIADLIDKVIKDEELYNKIANKAYEKVLQNFTVEKQVEKIQQLLIEI